MESGGYGDWQVVEMGKLTDVIGILTVAALLSARSRSRKDIYFQPTASLAVDKLSGCSKVDCP